MKTAKKQATRGPRGASRQKKGSKPAPQKQNKTGILSVSRSGTGYIREPGNKSSFYIVENEDLGTGFHGDTVTFTPGKEFRGKKKARVTAILSRAKAGFVGTMQKKDGVFVFIADDPRCYTPINIPAKEIPKDVGDQKIFIEIAEWKDMHTLPMGRIIRVLGAPLDNETVMQGIALERGFDSSFPPFVEDETRGIASRGIRDEDSVGRKDMRGVPTFTIDPADAKDFDDALSVRTLEGGSIEVGIHIADVSFYVRPETALDKEALRRGTSVYLVDRTIPMLPHILSNDLCSLKPNVDRLTMSVVVTMKNTGEIVDVWYGRTIIHSIHRFTYEEAQEVLETNNGPLREEIALVAGLARILFTERTKEGTLSLDTTEIKCVLDERGKPVSFYRKERLEAHKLIEEWMLFANKKVAEVFGQSEKKGGLGVYRVHDLPNNDKIADFRFLLDTLGYTMPAGPVTPKSLSEVLDILRDAPEKDFLTTLLIRSMAKAVYSTTNIGHFGLGFDDYTHFTSPIRRYPDLMVHRLLDKILKGNQTSQEEQKKFERIALYASAQEKNAAEAERASLKYKQIEYMLEHIGKESTGIVSGVTDRGIFVEDQDTGAEGMIQLDKLGTEVFTPTDRDTAVIGAKTKQKLRIGDSLRIKVIAVDLNDQRIDFECI